MKVISITLLALTALAQGDQNIRQKFKDFKLKYEKTYSSFNEELKRMNIFQANLAEIEAHNNGRSSYKKGVNQFTDLTKEEWNITRQLPDSVNWVEAGAVTDVKNQGACGSCWAFSLTSQVESYNFLATGDLVELSTQQVTSCTPNTLSCGGTGGCRGSVTQLLGLLPHLPGGVLQLP